MGQDLGIRDLRCLLDWYRWGGGGKKVLVKRRAFSSGEDAIVPPVISVATGVGRFPVPHFAMRQMLSGAASSMTDWK